MTKEETVTLTRKEYEALIERNGQLEDHFAALEADDGIRVPHDVALDIIKGRRPYSDVRKHQSRDSRKVAGDETVSA